MREETHMSRNAQISFRESGRVGPSWLARLPAACRDALDSFGLAGRSNCVVPPFTRKLLFENLEPRVLLSADLTPAASAFVAAVQADNQSALSRADLSLTDDSGSLPVVDISGRLAAAIPASGALQPSTPADQWRLDLEQGDVISLGVATPISDPGRSMVPSAAGGREVASDPDASLGTDALIGHPGLGETSEFYVQVSRSGDREASSPRQLLGDLTATIQWDTDVRDTSGTLTNTGQALAPGRRWRLPRFRLAPPRCQRRQRCLMSRGFPLMPAASFPMR